MLFKFKSQASADLIMLEADARHLLKIMLGDDPAKGILLVEDIPVALTALELAVSQDDAARKQRSEKAQTGGSGGGADEANESAIDPVRLSQRATPMMKLLKLCQSQQSNVVWGV
jgi:hypothetical protein